jgi:EAL and modified HD-GYP domain-containing signal transduction protein
MPDIYVGRQPIYNKSLGVFGYELLFRAGHNNAAVMDDITADGATSTTIINSFLEIGLEKLVGNRFAFINLTEGFLNKEEALPFGPKQVIIEVLEDIPINLQLLKSIKRLSEAGFTIALDDFIFNPTLKPLVAMADIVKIDIMQLSQKELIKHVKILRKFKAKLLAEKIETMEEFEFCTQLGFDYFQGYFLSKPKIIKSKSLPTNKLAVLNLLSALHNPHSEIDELEEAISFDVSISFKILKLINSAFFNFPGTVESIRQAIVILGRNQLRGWASMLAMSNLDNRPSEMIHMAMTRAKMCELLAEAAGLEPLDSYFTVGLFSALDILMEKELNEIIKPLPLGEDLIIALLRKEGVLGEALRCVLAYETSDFDNAKFQNLEPNDIFVTNIEAVSWANMVIDTL